MDHLNISVWTAWTFYRDRNISEDYEQLTVDIKGLRALENYYLKVLFKILHQWIAHFLAFIPIEKIQTIEAFCRSFRKTEMLRQNFAASIQPASCIKRAWSSFPKILRLRLFFISLLYINDRTIFPRFKL